MRLVRAFVGALVVCSASACVTIPDSSPVRQSDQGGVEDQEQRITNRVLGPFDGADPKQVVEGFYAAMLAYPPTADTARLFLTPAAAKTWDPDTSLNVYDEPETVLLPSEKDTQMPRVRVTTAPTGSLDSRGQWTSAVPGSELHQPALRLRQVDGEWRITNPQDGTFIDSDFFTRFYDPYSLYFFDPSRTILTPDPVYLPVGDTTATALVKDLLLGPTADLQKAVYSAVPADTELDVGVSVARSGVAEVPVSANVLKLSAGDRQLFAAQLAWTLRQVPGVEQISISVDGADLAIENASTPFDADSFAGYDPAGLSGERRLFALDKGGLVTVSDGDVSPVVGPIRQVSGGETAAVQTSGQLAAIVRAGGRSVAVGPVPSVEDGGVATWFAGGTRLLRPSWDAQQVLWLVDRTDDGPKIFAVDADGAQPVPAPGLAGKNIVAFAVSRDGVRLAAIVEGRDGSRVLLVSTIDRDAQDPTKAVIRDPRVVSNAGVNLIGLSDLAWVSPISLAVLAHEPGGDQQPYEVAIDGSDIEAAGGFLPVEPRSIAAGPNADAPIAVGTSDGQLYVQTPDHQWLLVDVAGSLRAPVYPG
jgi:hypothetical protein